MAVLEFVPGIEVTVCIDGEPLQEYEDEGAEDDDKSIIRYIEATSDKAFALELRVGPPYVFDCPTLGFTVHVDGKEANSPLLEKKVYLLNKTWTYLVDGVNSRERGRNVIRAFKFSELKTSK